MSLSVYLSMVTSIGDAAEKASGQLESLNGNLSLPPSGSGGDLMHLAAPDLPGGSGDTITPDSPIYGTRLNTWLVLMGRFKQEATHHLDDISKKVLQTSQDVQDTFSSIDDASTSLLGRLSSQRDAVRDFLNTTYGYAQGTAGIVLDPDILQKYADFYDKLKTGGTSLNPQMIVYLNQQLQALEEALRIFGGQFGRDFSFSQFKHDLDASRGQRSTQSTNSGTVVKGGSNASGKANISLAVLRWAGGLR